MKNALRKSLCKDVSPGQLNSATLSTSQRLITNVTEKILRVPWTQRRTNADIRNELEVPEGWLLNTAYWRKVLWSHKEA